MDDRNPLGEPGPQDDPGVLRKWWNGLGDKVRGYDDKMRAAAAKPMWGETQWRGGPDGYNYIPFPQKGSNAADAGLGALMGLAGLSSRMGAMQLARPGPPEYAGRLPASGTLGAQRGVQDDLPGAFNLTLNRYTGQPEPNVPVNNNAAPGGADPLSYYRALLEQKRGQFTVIPGDKP